MRKITNTIYPPEQPLNLKTGFPPIANSATELLILGSMPGDESIRRQQYYGHPQNRFWKIIAALYHEAIPIDYIQKKELALSHQTGIWDVIQTAQRSGSMDTAIKNEIPNPLPVFIARHRRIRIIGFNGAKARQVYERHFPTPEAVEMVTLPSSSPANARYSLEDLIEIWKGKLLFPDCLTTHQ